MAFCYLIQTERMFEEVKNILPKWGLQIAPVNYLGYRIGLQKIRTQKAQIRRKQLQTQ